VSYNAVCTLQSSLQAWLHQGRQFLLNRNQNKVSALVMSNSLFFRNLSPGRHYVCYVNTTHPYNNCHLSQLYTLSDAKSLKYCNKYNIQCCELWLTTEVQYSIKMCRLEFHKIRPGPGRIWVRKSSQVWNCKNWNSVHSKLKSISNQNFWRWSSCDNC